MKLIAVLGMHRSGTSAFTGLLSEMGVDLGPEEGLLPPAEDNPAGFFENEELYRINQQLLHKFGGHWTSPPLFPPGWESKDLIQDERRRATVLLERLAKRTDSWLAIKDPRLCLLIPFWESLYPVDLAFHVVRHPFKVATSLQERNGMAIETTVLLWLRYVSSAYRHHPEAVRIDYDDLVENTSEVTDRVSAMLGDHVSSTSFDDSVVRADFRHNRKTGALDSDVGRLSVRVYNELTSSDALSAETRELLRVLGDPAMSLITRESETATVSRLENLANAKVAPVGANLTKIQTQLESLEEKYRLEKSNTKELSKRLDRARTRMQSAESSYERLRGRRSVRMALKGASLLAPVFRPVRTIRRRNKQRRQKEEPQELASQLIPLDSDASAPEPPRLGLVVTHGRHGPQSSAFIRLINPLTQESVVDQVSVGEIDYEDPDPKEVVIVQRTSIPTPDEVHKFVGRIRSQSSRLVVDVDDAFLLIDSSHPEYQIYQKRNEALEVLLKESDQAWFSTPLLSELYDDVAPNDVRIIKNALDPRLWRSNRGRTDRIEQPSGPARLLFMGTATHDADFAMLRDALSGLARSFDFTLTVIGALRHPPADLPWLEVVNAPEGVDVYPEFVRWLKAQPPFDIGVSPLLPSKFNEAKSDIKFLDYSALGLVSVLSEGPAYQEVIDKNLAVGAGPDDWAEALGSILEDLGSYREMREAATAYLWSERSTVQMAERMVGALDELTGRAG